MQKKETSKVVHLLEQRSPISTELRSKLVFYAGQVRLMYIHVHKSAAQVANQAIK